MRDVEVRIQADVERIQAAARGAASIHGAMQEEIRRIAAICRMHEAEMQALADRMVASWEERRAHTPEVPESVGGIPRQNLRKR